MLIKSDLPLVKNTIIFLDKILENLHPPKEEWKPVNKDFQHTPEIKVALEWKKIV